MSLIRCCFLIILSFATLTSKVGAVGKLHLENSSLDPSLLVKPGWSPMSLLILAFSNLLPFPFRNCPSLPKGCRIP